MSNLVTLKVKAVKEIDWGGFLLKNKNHIVDWDTSVPLLSLKAIDIKINSNYSWTERA